MFIYELSLYVYGIVPAFWSLSDYPLPVFTQFEEDDWKWHPWHFYVLIPVHLGINFIGIMIIHVYYDRKYRIINREINKKQTGTGISLARYKKTNYEEDKTVYKSDDFKLNILCRQLPNLDTLFNANSFIRDIKNEIINQGCNTDIRNIILIHKSHTMLNNCKLGTYNIMNKNHDYIICTIFDPETPHYDLLRKNYFVEENKSSFNGEESPLNFNIPSINEQKVNVQIHEYDYSPFKVNINFGTKQLTLDKLFNANTFIKDVKNEIINKGHGKNIQNIILKYNNITMLDDYKLGSYDIMDQRHLIKCSFAVQDGIGK